MGHNCGTCRKWLLREAYDQDFERDLYLVGTEVACSVGGNEELSVHPSDLHPCEHGEAIVASAVAAVEFAVLPHGDVHALHAHDSILITDWWLNKGRFCGIAGDNFCSVCGLKHPTAEQVQQMYERWKQENEREERP